MGLAGVLDNHQAALLGNFEDRIHVSGLPVKVDRNDGLGPLGDGGVHCVHIHRERARIDIHEYGRGAGVVNRRHSRNKGERDGDDLVARANVRCQQSEV